MDRSKAVMDRRKTVRETLMGSTNPGGMIDYISVHSSTNPHDPTELTIEVRHDVAVEDALLHLAGSIIEAVGESADVTDIKPKEAFASGPVVGIVWPDGKKTMTRCDEDDECDVNVGLMTNYLRRAVRNRERYDELWDDAACGAVAMADVLKNPDDMLRTARMLEFLADAHRLLGDRS